FGEPGDQLRIFAFHVDFTVPANSTFTERNGSPLAVAAFDPIPVPNSRNVVPQPPPATAASFLDAISDRLMYRLSYRNFGTTETLIANHTVNAATNPAFRAGVRFYQLNRVAPAAPFTIGEQQTWAPADTEQRWMGSAANNFQGDVAVGFSTSSLTVSPSVRYAARLGTDTAGTGLIQGETVIEAGGGSQTHTSGRWGDYSDITVDPSDDCSFWYTQEYYTVSAETGNTTAPWHTRISKFAPGPCATSPRGTISGTVTNCQTGLPIPNAFVTISGGFSRATGAAGTYSAIVTPGTYNVSITSFGYDTASTTGLVIANGGAATFNACLNGNLKQPVADTATVTADSCNSNGFVDPNETVTVSLGVKNTGTLNTVNLVGTLQATGGVTSPSGPQNYGVVVAGGATVFRSFTFTAGNLACGAPLVISLQMQDGATNLGTITYNLTTGTIAVSNYSTGNISVPIPDSPAPAINIPITVADVMTLTDVNVSFRINHTFDGDLQIALVHPDNTVIPLVTNRGSSGANFGTGTLDCAGVPTLIDDQAATAITAGSAPFAGTFRPESPLSALNGKPSNGTWNLRIQDTAGQDTGTVGCVKLELNKRNVCCGALINASPPPVITAESISPANNAADPEETVTVNLSLVNVGGSPTTNLVATLQPTGGVAGPSGPQNYGVLAAIGGTATRPFTFTAQGTCGSTITLTLALQDGATNLGTVTFTMTLGAPTVNSVFTENFDGVTAPALPAGWVTAASGSEVAWVTSATNPISAPNDAFAPDVTTVGNTVLDTPTINVPATGGQLTFRNLFNMEAAASPTGAGFDGMVLEISINGGAFADITTGGNAFVAGGYTRTISGSFSSPIANRQAWSGLSGGTTAAPTYITSTINLPAAASGQPIKLRWRAATDTSAVASGAAGVRIDNISLVTNGFVCNSQSCTITGPTSMTIPPGTCGTNVTYSPAVSFTGACGAVVVNPPTGSFFGIGTTTVLVRGTRADASFTDASFPVTVQESETQATGLGANVANNFCNTRVTYTAVTGAGSTTVVDAPQQTLPPPYVHCAACPELNITTTSTFTAPVTTCITMPASTDAATFNQLRILHGEPGLVNRTITSNFSTKTICARTSTVSPFVVARDPNAPTATPASISGRVVSPDGAPLAGVTMKLSGAQSAKVITDSNGNYIFNDVDPGNFYTVTPAILNYHFSPESTSFSLLGNKTDAVFTGSVDAVIHGNVIDTPDYFVRQHYLDFLGREPDVSGFNFWSDQIISCGADAGCRERRTINVSAAYVLSIEFRETGELVDSLYRSSYGHAPLYAEFMPDTRTIANNIVVGVANWQRDLEANKQAFTNAWVQRPEFQAAYGGLSNEGYVDTLISHTGVVFSQSERDDLIDGLVKGSLTRAGALRRIAENQSFVNAKRNAVFVMMEYFGYLRRDPDASGFQFWLNKLNQFGGNFEQAEMVKAFLNSGEYRQRFVQ
ncbi:MAG TPA: carboxypeptidase regulatory-like domain-containing protein, partial [Pyrinomonadaceae bacterium]|nr:carboxypeptidase regulatory-like domain-containing protein [Pyrinomonadaceae bacterium]